MSINLAIITLGTLLLVEWVINRQDKIEGRKKGLKAAISHLSVDTKLAAQDVIEAHKEIAELRKKLQPVEEEISNLHGRMSVLRKNLESEARENLETIRMINFTANMAATLCMVIPVGQPVLGAVGSLASIATEYATSDDSQKGLKALKDTGERMTKLADDLVAEAEIAKANAEAAREEKTDVEISEDVALKRSKERALAVTGLGTVISGTADEMAKLQVPQSEVDAELERLKRKSKAWETISNDIREINKKKAALQLKLVGASQRLGESYSRITANTTAIYNMRLQHNQDASRLTPEGVGHLRQMGQRARLALQKYLYLMVKAYETTVFKTIDVEWNPMALTKKIQELIGVHSDFSEAIFTIGSDSELLKIYLENVEKVREKLIDHLTNAPGSSSYAFLILNDKDPHSPEKAKSGFLAPLNNDGEQIFDPLKIGGIVHPDSHLMMLNSIELEADIETDPAYPALTPDQQVKISIQPVPNGTVRRDHDLYAVYGDRSPVWSAQLTGGKKGKLIQSKESEHNKELLDFIVEDATIQHKLARPPLWSNYLVTLTHEIPEDQRPKITRTQFKLNYDSSEVDKNKRLCVLDIREAESAPADEEFVITCQPGDMRYQKGRENGLKNMVRIYSAGTPVTFKVPPRVGNRKFERWELTGYKIDPRPKLDNPEITFTIRSNVVAKHFWREEEKKNGGIDRK